MTTFEDITPDLRHLLIDNNKRCQKCGTPHIITTYEGKSSANQENGICTNHEECMRIIELLQTQIQLGITDKGIESYTIFKEGKPFFHISNEI
jgi:hypothetical protein